MKIINNTQSLSLPSVVLLSTLLFPLLSVSVSSFGINTHSLSSVSTINTLSISFLGSRNQFKLQMTMGDDECPEIPTTAQLDPKYDTCVIALG